MRLATRITKGASRAVLAYDGGCVDPAHPAVAAKLSVPIFADVGALLGAGDAAIGAYRRLYDDLRRSGGPAETLGSSGGFLACSDVDLAAPVRAPGIILCMGRSYGRHLAEMMGPDTPRPTLPNGFLKSPHCVIGPGDDIILPAHHPGMVDYEGEIAVVFGTRCFQTTATRAMSHIAGYLLANEVSARDWNAPHGQPQDWDMVRLGKQFPSFMPLGPALVTCDEIGSPEELAIQTRLNGELVQNSNTSDLLFSIAEMIAYYSCWYEFRPGDILSTGTPEGVGAARIPPRYLRPGDRVDIHSPLLGTLTNHVAPARHEGHDI